LLNDTFGTDALAGGVVIDAAKITVNTACPDSVPKTKKGPQRGPFHGRSWIRTRDLFLIREAL
jgi:hypothetical protein